MVAQFYGVRNFNASIIQKVTKSFCTAEVRKIRKGTAVGMDLTDQLNLSALNSVSTRVFKGNAVGRQLHREDVSPGPLQRWRLPQQ